MRMFAEPLFPLPKALMAIQARRRTGCRMQSSQCRTNGPVGRRKRCTIWTLLAISANVLDEDLPTLRKLRQGRREAGSVWRRRVDNRAPIYELLLGMPRHFGR